MTATKPPVSQTAGDAVNVGEGMHSGHLRCHLVGQGANDRSLSGRPTQLDPEVTSAALISSP